MLIIKEYVKLYTIMVCVIALFLILVTAHGFFGSLDKSYFAFELFFTTIFSIIIFFMVTILLGQNMQRRFVINFINNQGFEFIEKPEFPKVLSKSILPKHIEFVASGKYGNKPVEIGFFSTYRTQTSGLGFRAYQQFRFYVHWQSDKAISAGLKDEFAIVNDRGGHYLLSAASVYTEDEIAGIINSCLI